MRNLIIALLVVAGTVAYPQTSLRAAAQSSSGQIVDLTSGNADAILSGSKPVVIKVYTDWCGPCKAMNPIFDEVVSEFGSRYTFTKLNGDAENQLVKNLKIAGYPTVLYYNNGKEVGRSVGYQSKTKLISEMKNAFGG